ncbi:MAG: sigma-70 family RNA polymerase sigma factor [Candidatus Binataceae bacterium]
MGLMIQGSITGDASTQLRKSCEPFLTAGKVVALDLSAVTFADSDGIATLKALRSEGALVAGSSPFVDELLRERPEPAHNVPAPHHEEARLIAQLRAGDDQAFETLVRKFGARMLATARRYLPNEQDARDAVQEAFISAFNAIGRFHGDSMLSTWLHRIVVNAALMQIRYKRRRPEESIDDLLPNFNEHGRRVLDGEHAEGLTETILERAETRDMVRRCIEKLPHTYRTVLMLRDIDELDTDQAAQILGVSSNAVKIRLHRARQALKTLLERELSASPSNLQPKTATRRRAAAAA